MGYSRNRKCLRDNSTISILPCPAIMEIGQTVTLHRVFTSVSTDLHQVFARGGGGLVMVPSLVKPRYVL